MLNEPPVMLTQLRQLFELRPDPQSLLMPDELVLVPIPQPERISKVTPDQHALLI